jgi:excisionase family DNA binding protein
VDWGFRVERDGTITPDAGLTEAQLRVLEAKLKVSLARVQLMIVEKGVRYRVPEVAQSKLKDAVPTVEKRGQPEKLLLRIGEVAEILGVGRSKCYEMIATGDIPSVKLGKLVRVSRAELEAWLANRSSKR